MGESLGRIGLVQVPRDDHRIAIGLGRLRSGRRRDERNLSAIGRPGDGPAGARQRRVRAGHLGDKSCLAAVGMRDDEACLTRRTTAIRDPPAVRRPLRIAGRLLVAAQADSLSVGPRQHPHLRVGSTGAVVVLDGIGEARGIGRQLDGRDRSQLQQVATLQAILGAGRRSQPEHGRGEQHAYPRHEILRPGILSLRCNCRFQICRFQIADFRLTDTGFQICNLISAICNHMVRPHFLIFRCKTCSVTPSKRAACSATSPSP